MRRHPALIPISRFHRSVLFLALILKKNPPKVKGYPESWEDKIVFAKSFYSERLSNHFKKEETLLIPVIKGVSADLDAISDKVIKGHQLLSLKFEQLNAKTSVNELNQLGEMLEKHIRMEERQWFQQMQQDVPQEELNKIDW